MEWISQVTSSLVDKYGLFGIFIGMVLESACIPIPSEVLMLVGGFFAAKGTFGLGLVIGLGVIGNMLGSILIYWIGASGARVILDRYGKYVFIHSRHIHKAEAWFTRYGEWSVGIGRVLPVIRTFISLPAGICRMSFTKFVTFSLLGCVIWDFLLAYLGYQLGQNWHVVESYLKPLSYLVVLCIFGYVSWMVVKGMRKQQS